MNKNTLVKSLGMSALFGAAALAFAGTDKPPVAPVRNVVDEYYGTKVQDPYRYMEKLDDPEVAAWFKGQAAFTEATLAAIPGRKALLARMEELDRNTPAVVKDVRRLPGDRVFYQKRLASDNVFKLYVRQGLAGAERLLVDPDKFVKKEREHMALSWWEPSQDGRMVAFGLSPAGSEAAVLHIVDVQHGTLLSDTIDRCYFGGVSWAEDNKSFAYNRLQQLPASAPPADKHLNSHSYLHLLGRDPEQDPVLFGTGIPGLTVKPTDMPLIRLTPGSRYVIAFLYHGAQRTVTIYKQPLASLGTREGWTKFLDVEDAVTDFSIHGDDLYAVSQRGASRRRLLAAKLSDDNFQKAKILIPQGQSVIEDTTAASDALYVRSAEAGVGKVTRVGYESNQFSAVPQPEATSTWRMQSDVRIPGVVMVVSSWIRRDTTYAYDPTSRTTTDTHLQPESTAAISGLRVSEVQVKSHDGTSVPLTIVCKEGLVRDGQNPTLMTGYGAYGISLDPFFNPTMQAWLERGGIYAVAHIRGGGEYGEDWHLAGKGLTKENTWKDFIACAQYLITEKYTSPHRLGIMSGSAGGITIGRSLTERPDLFAAAIDAVPASDMVRFELSPNGPPNTVEFGTVKNQDGFAGLLKMSAYHHVKDGISYPAVLVTTGFNDPRVIAWQPGKMAARLQAATSSNKPVLLRVDYDAGHGVGSTKRQSELEQADEFSFLLWQMGVPEFQPKAASNTTPTTK